MRICLHAHQIAFYLLLGLTALVPIACHRRTTYTLGFSSSLTGRGASLGKDLYEGTLLAVEEINREEGPVRIQLVVRDDGGDKGRALANAKEFAEMGIEVVMGYATSAIADAVLPFLSERKMMLLGASISSPIFDKKDDCLFRVVNSSTSEARAVADHTIETYGPKIFIGIFDLGNAAYAENWVKTFQNRYQVRGGIVPLVLPFQTRTPPAYQEVIDEALQKEPRATGLCIVASSIDTAGFAQAFKQRVPDGIIAVSGWGNNQDLITYGGKAVEGAIIAQSHNPIDSSPGFLRFKAKFQETFGRIPTFGSVHAYETVRFLEAALRQRKPGEPLKEALKRIREIQGVQRKIRFDETGDAYRPLFILTVREGAFTLISEREPEL
ncbi:MAG: ABC transporter substrate-binding protein [Spirochaetes bacterium]|nr:ABC transporter substrate-binding protein [Spirochaetota bacterium]